MRVVLEGGQGGDLAEPVHVVGGADAVETVDGLGAGHRVADAQTGQPAILENVRSTTSRG